MIFLYFYLEHTRHKHIGNIAMARERETERRRSKREYLDLLIYRSRPNIMCANVVTLLIEPNVQIQFLKKIPKCGKYFS